MNKECEDCDYYCDGACLCSPLDKWYACPIESSKPENQQALREYAEQVRKKTNGDVIMAMFPDCRPCIGTEIVDTDITVFEREWWDAPYEKDYISKDILDKIRAEINNYGSIWVEYKIIGHTDRDIEKIVKNVLSQAKEQVLDIIDKYKAESEE